MRKVVKAQICQFCGKLLVVSKIQADFFCSHRCYMAEILDETINAGTKCKLVVRR